MDKFRELSLEEMQTFDGGRRFWDTFGGKLVFATCAAIIAGFVALGFREVFQ